jgi:urea-proton symporter
MLPITDAEAGAGLVPPAVATQLLGHSGAVLILIMLFMAITSTGASESIAVSSLVAYDIYREYMNPQATGEQIVFVSRVIIVAFGLFSGTFAILLQVIGVNLGWVYLFMGICIGSAVCPLWNMMTWSKASGTGAVIAAWSGFILAVIGWLLAAKSQSGTINVDTLGTNEVMLSGNLIAICSSGIIHYVYSVFVDPQDYDFDELDKNISLVENDLRGLTAEEKDPKLLKNAESWIVKRGFALTIILIVVWPLLSIPAGVFSKSYFAFWVLISIAWGFGAGIVITILPLTESSEEINSVLKGMITYLTGKTFVNEDDDDDDGLKKVDVTNRVKDEEELGAAKNGTTTPPHEEEVEG